MNYQYSTYFFATLSVIFFVLLILGYEGAPQKISTPINSVSYNNTTPAIDHSMHSMMMDMTSRMQGKTGDELDRIFLEDMIVHHQGAIDMAALLVTGTERTELRTLGEDIIEAQTAEITQMEAWLNEWYAQ